MNEIDVLEETIEEYRKVKRLKKLNENLTEQLLGSIQYLIEYSEKYHFQLPKKTELLQMVENGYSLLQQLDPQQPKSNTNKTTDNETEP